MARVPKQPAVIVPEKNTVPTARKITRGRAKTTRAPKTKLQVLAQDAATLRVRVRKISTSTPTKATSTRSSTAGPKIARRGKQRITEPVVQAHNADQASERVLSDEVTTPSAASERLLSKSKALTAWYNTKFGAYAARTAYAVGFIFIATAGSVLAAQTANQFSSWADFQNAAICATLPCESSSDTTAFPPSVGNNVSAATSTVIAPAIRFRTAPPENAQETFEVIIAAENASDVQLFVESRTTAAKTIITPASESTATELRFAIDPKRFIPGDYQLRASARALSGGTVVYTTGGRFTVRATTQTNSEPVRTPETSQPKTAATTSTVSRVASSTSIGTTPSSSTTLTTQMPAFTRNEAATTPTPTTPAVPSSPPIITENTTSVTSSPSVVPVKVAPINLVVEAGVDMTFTAKIRALSMAKVEVLAERTQASQPFFLGNAVTFENGYWLLSFAGAQLPNGNYSVYVRGTSNAGTVHLSDRLPLRINIQPKVSVSATDSTTVTSTSTPTQSQPRTALKVNDVPVERERYLSAPESVTEKDFVAATTTPALDSERKQIVADYVDKSLDTHEAAINELLQRYASAYQAGNAELQALARAELEKKQQTIVTEALDDTDGKTAVAEIENTIDIEFAKLQKRVEFFEELLKERSNTVSTIDTDLDGVSDYDEESLYSTDQRNPDTDGDGINDGTEIAAGYDPASAAAEALMVFDSPKGFGVVRADVLAVETVIPLVETDTTRGVPKVQAQIRGRGLPNSFVTLFIYSTPVVVTVKTDADGNFVYEFERELEDGSHEVYAAVTDNRGAIVAKSAPFGFIKQAEAFTPLATTQETQITNGPDSFSPVTNVFLVISSLVVLMFGLILIILGLMVRREPTIVATEDFLPAA